MHVVDFYNSLARRRTVGYGALISQQVRFESLVRLMGHPDSLLDVGCGSGDLISFLKDRQLLPEVYLGVDISPEMVKWASERWPQYTFAVGNAAHVPMVFEWVVGMGIFEVGVTDSDIRQTLLGMFSCCTEAIAVTALWKDASLRKPEDILVNPFELVSWVRKELSERIVLDFGYAPHCYTLFAFKKKSVWQVQWESKGGW